MVMRRCKKSPRPDRISDIVFTTETLLRVCSEMTGFFCLFFDSVTGSRRDDGFPPTPTTVPRVRRAARDKPGVLDNTIDRRQSSYACRFVRTAMAVRLPRGGRHAGRGGAAGMAHRRPGPALRRSSLSICPQTTLRGRTRSRCSSRWRQSLRSDSRDLTRRSISLSLSARAAKKCTPS